MLAGNITAEGEAAIAALQALAAFNPHPTVGAYLIGCIVSSFLFGIVTLQCYIYFERFQSDHWVLKTLVGIIWVLELAHTICVSAALYTMAVSNYADPISLEKPPRTLDISVFLSGCIAPIVQAIFAERVRRFSGSWIIPFVCWTLSFLRFVGSMVMGAGAVTMKNLSQFEDDWGWLIKAILAIGAVVDVIIALSLCWALNEKRARAFDGTMRLVNVLTKWAIETGTVTSIAAISVFVTFTVMEKNFIWIALYTLLARCFSNSLLATLNGRTSLREMNASSQKDSNQRRSGNSSAPKPYYSNPIQIAVETTTTHISQCGPEGEYYGMHSLSKTSPSEEKFATAY